MKAAKARIATIALGGLLALTACSGTTSAQTAAKVDGRVITEQEVADATTQINEAFNPQQPFTPVQTLNYLILAPYVIDAAAKAGQPVSESAARAEPSLKALEDGVADSTIEAVRADASLRALQQADPNAGAALAEQIADLDVSVNPRYGTFDPERAAVVADQPNWIVPSAPAAAPAQ